MSNYSYGFGDVVQPSLMDGMSTLDQTQATWNAQTQTDLNSQNSMWGKGGSVDQGMGIASKGIGMASSLGQLYVGLKSLGIAEDELDIKKDQWAMSKAELQHMQETRKRLTSSYMGNKPSPQGQAQAKPQTKGASALAGRY